MARISFTRLIAFILGATGGFLVVNALGPQIQAMVPGGWLFTMIAGIVLVVGAIYVGRR
jgi:uncharacterized membrane protein required for colicin V production